MRDFPRDCSLFHKGCVWMKGNIYGWGTTAIWIWWVCINTFTLTRSLQNAAFWSVSERHGESSIGMDQRKHSKIFCTGFIIVSIQCFSFGWIYSWLILTVTSMVFIWRNILLTDSNCLQVFFFPDNFLPVLFFQVWWISRNEEYDFSYRGLLTIGRSEKILTLHKC